MSAFSPGSPRLRGAGLPAQRRTAREEGVRPPESAGGPAPAAPTLAVLPAGSRTPASRLHAREPWGLRSALWAEGGSHRPETATGSRRGGHRCKFSVLFSLINPSASEQPLLPTLASRAVALHPPPTPLWSLRSPSPRRRCGEPQGAGLTRGAPRRRSNSGPEKGVTVADAIKRH